MSSPNGTTFFSPRTPVTLRPVLYYIALSALLSLTSVAAASTPTPDSSDSTSTHDHSETSSSGELVEEIEANFPLRILDAHHWDIADLHSVLRGAKAIPGAVWDLIDRPVAVEYVARDCLFGVGRYNNRCPTFGDDVYHFFLYDSPPVVGEGSMERLQILDRSEQRDLQVRRGIVHLAIYHLDRTLGWSDARRWRTINGWPPDAKNALNHDPWGYSRYLGMRSARLDLVTFAEEFFVRPEDILLETPQGSAARLRLADVDPDQTVHCQQFTRRRFFNDHLLRLDGEWSEPERRLPHRDADEPRCPAFERWARPDQLQGFDILLAAATADQPESLFGHLLFHVRYGDDERVHGRGFEPVYQFGAVTDEDVDPIEYFTRGFLGGFPSVLELNTFRGIDRLFLQHQQRDLRRYRLRLSDEQARHVLQRVWETERRIRYPYLFLSDNCASFIIDLIAPALDLPIPERQGAIVMPTDVLDALGELSNPSIGGPLLEKRAASFRSNRRIAEEASHQRQRLLEQFDDAFSPQLSASLHRAVDGLNERSPARRHDGYEELSDVVDTALSTHPELSQQLVDFLYYSVQIERYFMERAHYARRAVYARAHEGPEPLTIDEILQRRREIYRTEDLEARLELLQQRAMEAEAPHIEGPQREFTDAEQAVIDYEETTRDTYLVALQLQSATIDRHDSNWSGVDYLDDKSATYRSDQKRIDSLSKIASGRNHVAVGAAIGPDRRVGLDLSYSMMTDRLGEIRRRGYPGDLGVRMGGLDISIPFQPRGLRNLQLDFILLNYQSLQQTHGPVRQSLIDALGWSLDARITHDGRRGLWAGAELSGSVLIPLWTASDKTDHLVTHFGGGLRYDVYTDQNPLAGLTGGIFGQLHLYDNYSNTLRLGIDTGHFIGFGPQWRYDARAYLETRHAVAEHGDRPLVVVPFVEGMQTTRDYREQPDEPFRDFKGGLRVELPF